MNSFTAWAGVAWVNPHTPYLGPLMLMLDMVMLFTPGNRTLLDTLAETNIFSYPIAESS
ncbi:MAG: hypothetical protein KZQ93_17915 [Candidatus Thiodiazotropha sp. (ex Monitilora ramsayi)]|nr:hypothetical protein [Candidatus Thiodiazotropha sp. (ex Monitilora ramsayi)]